MGKKTTTTKQKLVCLSDILVVHVFVLYPFTAKLQYFWFLADTSDFLLVFVDIVSYLEQFQRPNSSCGTIFIHSIIGWHSPIGPSRIAVCVYCSTLKVRQGQNMGTPWYPSPFKNTELKHDSLTLGSPTESSHCAHGFLDFWSHHSSQTVVLETSRKQSVHQGLWWTSHNEWHTSTVWNL